MYNPSKVGILLLAFCARASLGFPVSPGAGKIVRDYSNTPIRVLLEKHLHRISFVSPQGRLFIGYDGVPGWRQLKDGVNISLSPRVGGAVLTVDGAPVPGRKLYLRGGPHPQNEVRCNGRSYRGAIKVSLDGGTLTATNVLPLDSYLVGTLASEMSPHWELEALKAQAVASRSYALYMKDHPKSPVYDLEPGTLDQVYSGMGVESEKVRQAVRETQGEYLSANGKPIKAYFHSRCGGSTETAKAVWNQPGELYSTRVPCPYCRNHPFAWRSSVKLGDLLSRLAVPPAHPFSLIALGHTPTGRLTQIEVDDGARRKTLTADEFRALLGYARIKSAHFDWRIEGDSIEFEGTGAGHGVGMCQWGARALAEQGRNYRDILAYFYPHAQLEEAPAAPALAGLP